MPRGPVKNVTASYVPESPAQAREAVAGPIRALIAHLEHCLDQELRLAPAVFREPVEAQLEEQRRQLAWMENRRP